MTVQSTEFLVIALKYEILNEKYIFFLDMACGKTVIKYSQVVGT